MVGKIGWVGLTSIHWQTPKHMGEACLAEIENAEQNKYPIAESCNSEDTESSLLHF